MNRMMIKLSQRKGDWVLVFRPRLIQMPAPIQPVDDPFLPFGKAIINATADLVAGYLFDLASYMALGAAGLIALERTIAYVPDPAITILHGPFASPDYAAAAGAATFSVDAVTISDARFAGTYLKAGVGVFAPVGADDVGLYVPEESRLTYGQIALHLVGDEVVYADSTDQFASAIRAALKAKTI